MAILAYGINYRTAPLELRERVAFPEPELGEMLLDAKAAIPSLTEVALLSTCNRTELYAALDPADEVRLTDWLTAVRPVSLTELQDAAYRHWDVEAARHAIRVAAGLDSQVLGEPQIMGQLKAAYERARSAGFLGPQLNLLSQVSLNTAKRVRTDTDVGRNPISVAYAAVTMAERVFADLGNKKALLIGAGDTITLVAEHLAERGIESLDIANRTLENANLLARRFDGKALQLTEVAAELANYDVVISSTGSSLPVVGKGAVEAAVKKRKRRPIFMVDIAVPRDIEPEVGALPDVYLYTIDDLSEIIEENRRAREEAALSAESLVEQGARHYLREQRAHGSKAAIRQLRENAFTVQRVELERAQADLASGADPQAVIDRLARNLTNKLMHAPTVALRNASADGQSDLVSYLKKHYQLD